MTGRHVPACPLLRIGPRLAGTRKAARGPPPAADPWVEESAFPSRRASEEKKAYPGEKRV